MEQDIDNIELMEVILDKHWRKFLMSVCLPYSEPRPKTKEFIFLAMQEYFDKQQ